MFLYLNNETSPAIARTVFQDPFQDGDFQLPDHLSNLQEKSMLIAYHLFQKWYSSSINVDFVSYYLFLEQSEHGEEIAYLNEHVPCAFQIFYDYRPC